MKLLIRPFSPTPSLASQNILNTTIFVNDTLYQNDMLGLAGGGEAVTDEWAQLHYLEFTKAMEIYCICTFYLNEQTICPILTGIHKVYTL